MINKHLLCAILVTALGCATDYSKVRVVDLAKDNEYVSQFIFSCKNPVQLSQDCSGFSGPQRLISLDGARILMAGSIDGSVLFIVDSAVSDWGGLFTGDSFKSADQWTEGLNVRYRLVSDLLGKNGIEILRVVAGVQPPGIAYGYFIWCDGDAYSALKKFSL